MPMGEGYAVPDSSIERGVSAARLSGRLQQARFIWSARGETFGELYKASRISPKARHSLEIQILFIWNSGFTVA